MHCWRAGATQLVVLGASNNHTKAIRPRERNTLTPRPFSFVFVSGSVDLYTYIITYVRIIELHWNYKCISYPRTIERIKISSQPVVAYCAALTVRTKAKTVRRNNTRCNIIFYPPSILSGG